MWLLPQNKNCAIQVFERLFNIWKVLLKIFEVSEINEFERSELIGHIFELRVYLPAAKPQKWPHDYVMRVLVSDLCQLSLWMSLADDIFTVNTSDELYKLQIIQSGIVSDRFKTILDGHQWGKLVYFKLHLEIIRLVDLDDPEWYLLLRPADHVSRFLQFPFHLRALVAIFGKGEPNENHAFL